MHRYIRPTSQDKMTFSDFFPACSIPEKELEAKLYDVLQIYSRNSPEVKTEPTLKKPQEQPAETLSSEALTPESYGSIKAIIDEMAEGKDENGNLFKN